MEWLFGSLTCSASPVDRNEEVFDDEEVDPSATAKLEVVLGEPRGGVQDVHISVQPPAEGVRQPSDIVCVLDISGSMGREASIIGAGGASESHGLSLLDVAVHGVRTIAHTLGPRDRLAVVQFNHEAKVVLPLTAMNPAGRSQAEEELTKLCPSGGTSIWDGLSKGLSCLQGKVSNQARFGHIMLLTDGVSSGNSVIMQNVQDWRDQNEGLPGSINTFGFGYNLDSNILAQLATFGHGSYSFIPDAGFVGTCFVNTLSCLLSTMAADVMLTLEKPEGFKLGKVMAGYPMEDRGDYFSVPLGNVLYGQSRDLVVPVKAGSTGELSVAGSYKSRRGRNVNMEGVVVALGKDSAGAPCREHTIEQVCRCQFVDLLREVLEETKKSRDENGLKKCQERVGALGKAMEADAATSERVQAMLEDLQGQCSEALSRTDFFERWGVHYLPSLMFAHRSQICSNFKDPGVQFYGGQLFQDIRDKADEIFCGLPVPKPSCYVPDAAGAWTGAPVSMAAYHDKSAGCLAGDCPVQLSDGSHQPLASLVQGQQLAVAGGGVATLQCLVRVPCPSGQARLVELANGLRLTAHHPVFVEGEWRFPASLAEEGEGPCEALYSFVLEGAPALLVSGTPCIALGHGLDTGAAAHPYFAGQQVLRDLAGMKGFADGLVELPAGCMVRDPETGLVSSLLGGNGVRR